ncbi:MAG: AAA family ATPase [Sulfurovum sp.]|nr:AAA family ATPase [Sulfurovum sp.]
MKKLPIGIQTFKKIRDKQENYLYVDKTDIALQLIENNSYIFLSRPRRFGKSLFMDTLHNIFEGNKELFEDLAIYDKWDWETQYPVIKISFGNVGSVEELMGSLTKALDDNQKRLDIVCEKDYDYAICFSDLISKSYEKYTQKVVILIDEYDKPILDNM